MIKSPDVTFSQEETFEYLKSPNKYEFVGNESRFEEMIMDNSNEIWGNLGYKINHIERQKRYNTGGISIIVDLLLYFDNGEVGIVEVKKYNNKYPCSGPVEQVKALGQLLLYGSVIEGVEKKNAKLFLVDNKIFLRTVLTYGYYKVPIILIEIQADRMAAFNIGYGKK